MATKSLSFIYDNISSEDFGLFIGEINGNSLKEDMASTNTELIFDSINGRSENFVYGVVQSEKCLSFEIKLFSYTPISKGDISYVDNWLFANVMPKRLIFCQEDMATYSYDCIFTNNKTLYSGNECYGFSCTAVCSSAYAYELERSAEYDVKSGSVTKARFNNISGGIHYLYPRIEFVCNRDGGVVKIVNKSDNRTFEITGLSNGEKISIDEWFQITSSTDLRRIGNCNKQWLRFKKGINLLEISGDTSKVKVYYRFKKAIGS